MQLTLSLPELWKTPKLKSKSKYKVQVNAITFTKDKYVDRNFCTANSRVMQKDILTLHVASSEIKCKIDDIVSTA